MVGRNIDPFDHGALVRWLLQMVRMRTVWPGPGPCQSEGHRVPADARDTGRLGGPLHESEDRQLAVGLLFVRFEAGSGGGDLAPGFLTLRPVELFGDHVRLPAGGLDPD